MALEPLSAPFPPILTAADYEAIAARFWHLVESSVDLQLLLAMRETMREYEYEHPDAANAEAAKSSSGPTANPAANP